jgi:transposase
VGGPARGIKTKTALFMMRLSFSGRAAHRASLSQGQEAFLESHVYAFDRLGGVPIGQIRYDNLKPAVSRVLFGRTRVESDRWVAFRSHYGFDAFSCRRRPLDPRRSVTAGAAPATGRRRPECRPGRAGHRSPASQPGRRSWRTHWTAETPVPAITAAQQIVGGCTDG